MTEDDCRIAAPGSALPQGRAVPRGSSNKGQLLGKKAAPPFQVAATGAWMRRAALARKDETSESQRVGSKRRWQPSPPPVATAPPGPLSRVRPRGQGRTAEGKWSAPSKTADAGASRDSLGYQTRSLNRPRFAWAPPERQMENWATNIVSFSMRCKGGERGAAACNLPMGRHSSECEQRARCFGTSNQHSGQRGI
eukprot:2095869-Pyramimonas_sp.AAC.1